MSRRVVVTGVSGFVGPYLLDRLLADGFDVRALGRATTGPRPDVPYRQVRVLPTAPAGWDDLLDWAHADAVVHLAAQSHVPTSWNDPAGTLTSNLVTAAALFDAVRRRSDVSTVLTVGSSEEYGPQEPGPVGEMATPHPANPYALSKYAEGELARQILTRGHRAWYHVRPFNHIGPGQRRGFLVPDIASQIAAVERGEHTVLRIGDTSPVRDFLAVDDVAAAYSALLRVKPPSGIYNVASGRGRSVGEILENLLALSPVTIPVETDATRVRAADTSVFVGDPSKIRSATGWAPSTPLEVVLRRVLDSWRRASTP